MATPAKMVNEVTLSVCDNCGAIGYECDYCIACDIPMQKVVFVRKANQPILMGWSANAVQQSEQADVGNGWRKFVRWLCVFLLHITNASR